MLQKISDIKSKVDENNKVMVIYKGYHKNIKL